MNRETVIFLASDAGKRLVYEAFMHLEEHTEPVSALERLRKSSNYTDLAAAAWEVAQLRSRARPKLGADADTLLFDRDGYEMASSVHCAQYHAHRVAVAGASRVIDLCAGIGMDSIAMARAGVTVTAYEMDAARAEMIRQNARSCGVESQVDVRCEDATQADLPKGGAVFFDPARRAGSRRRLTDPDSLIPPLDFVTTLRASGLSPVFAKLGPGTDHGIATRYEGRFEFLSDGGECKEALLILGADTPGPPRVVLLPSRETLSCTHHAPLRPPVLERMGKYVYEPDPAVIRAGLVGEVARRVNGWLVDTQIPYVFSDLAVATDFTRRYTVLDAFPFHFKKLENALKALGAGHVEIKKRGVDIEPRKLASHLALRGADSFVVILTRSGKRQWCLIARPISVDGRDGAGTMKL